MIPGQISLADVENAGIKIKPKPSWIQVPKGYLWCPNCNWPVKFPKNKRLGVRKCEGCGISKNDFYVRLYNGLFN
ncbi:hypothetical protein [Wukongibacter sp. M2B1]|uniref:hypothetical protein n=1 Tax=Wukongibacter sp. M2B1 TaxID=3088895 RepID=UPI003D796560